MELTVESVSKQYETNQVQALSDASLTLRSGAVHALVGENGAGKSTLARILVGLEPPDSGRLLLNKEELTAYSAAVARDRGIRYVPQYPQFVASLTVWQNLILGEEPRRGLLLDEAGARRKLSECGKRHGIELNLGRSARTLTSGERHFAALLAALQNDPALLVLDEPTAVLTDEESRRLYSVIEALAAGGTAILLITHKLQELRQVASEMTVLRRGAVVRHLPAPFPSDNELAAIIFGDECRLLDEDRRLAEQIARSGPEARRHRAGAEVGSEEATRPPPKILEFDNFSSESFRGVAMEGLTFSVRQGEFLAVTGIRENGIESFEALLMGIVRGTSGVVRLFDKEYDRLGPRILRKAGIAYVPTDRLGSGASVLSTVAENLLIRERRRFHRFGVLRTRSIETLAESAADEFGIEGAPHDRLNRLSGGNIQKVILSREMRGTPPLLFVAEPSWGLDLRSRHLLYRQLLQLREKGSAVVLITTDLDEVQALADRVVVLYRGRNVAEQTHGEMDREKLGRAMIGRGGAG